MFKIRKLASVLAGALMVSSTIALAAAANYPAPFVQNGSADVAVVYGSSQVGGTDLVAAADIQSNLQAELAKQTATSTTATGSSASGGDSYKLERASTKFDLGQGMLDVVSGTVTDSDLPTLLKDGTYTDVDNNDFDYTQKVTLSNNSLTMFEDNDYKADVPTVGIRIPSGTHVLNYTMDFTTDPAWANLPTTDLTFLGKTYYVLSAVTNTSLTLLDSGQSASLNEGETKTLTVGNKTYEVKINFVGSNSTKLEVNGEVTKSLAPTGTYKLSDGTYVGIKEVNYNSKDTGVSSVEFSLGQGKLILTHGSDVEMNDDSISNLKAFFTNSSGNKLSTMTLSWTADNDLFVTQDSSPVMPGFNSLKLSFGGMTYPAEENITVDAGGDDFVQLKSFPLKDGAADINILYFNGTAYSDTGQEATKRLATSETSSLTFDKDTDQYFVASWSDGSNSESYLLRANSFTGTNGINKTVIQSEKNGAWGDVNTVQEGDTITNLGSVVLTVGAVDYNAKTVALTAGTNVNFKTLYSKEGMKVFLPTYPATLAATIAGNVTTAAQACGNITSMGLINGSRIGASTIVVSNTTGSNNINCTYFVPNWNLIFSEEDKTESKGLGKNITINLSSDTNADVAAVGVTGTTTASSTEIGSSKVFRNFVYSPLATEINWDKSGDQDLPVVLTYHGAESYGNVFLLAPSATVSNATTGTGSTGVKTLGSVIFQDSDSASFANSNIVVVGGSCVNSVAASLLGSGCGSDFTAKTGVNSGEFLIQTFARTGSSKIATLVAGYNAADTTNAAKYLTTQTPDTTVGKKYKGTTATSASLVTTSTA